MAMRPFPGLHFKHAASRNQSRRNHQDPHLVGMEQIVQWLENAGHQRRAGGQPRNCRRHHGQRRQAAAKSVKTN